MPCFKTLRVFAGEPSTFPALRRSGEVASACSSQDSDRTLQDRGFSRAFRQRAFRKRPGTRTIQRSHSDLHCHHSRRAVHQITKARSEIGQHTRVCCEISPASDRGESRTEGRFGASLVRGGAGCGTGTFAKIPAPTAVAPCGSCIFSADSVSLAPLTAEVTESEPSRRRLRPACFPPIPRATRGGRSIGRGAGRSGC